MSEQYDVLVLGAGPGGYVAAIRAAQLGASVAVVEGRELGGTCLNRGCIPTKILLECAHVLHLAERAGDFGVKVEGAVADYPAMNARKDKIVKMLVGGIGSLFRKNKIETIQGRGKLLDAQTVEVEGEGGKRIVSARKVIVATGSEPLEIPAFPYDGKRVISSDHALKLEQAPKSILIVGGGYIGSEWAGIFNRLGTKVTIVEMMDQLLPRSDSDVAKELFKAFKKSKIAIHLKTKVESIEAGKAGAVAKLSDGKEIEAETVMISIGRSLNTQGIGLEALGIETDRGAVPIDEHCMTKVPGVYAIGDITAKLMLAHLASKQGIVAVEHAMGKDAKMDYRVVPACVFTEPEIGTVGMTLAEAKEAGRSAKEAKFPFQTLGKAHALGETAGFVKIVGDEDTGEVLGVHIIGPHATDLVAEAGLAMAMEATVSEIADTIHAHPTLAEGMMECAHAWLGHLIHG